MRGLWSRKIDLSSPWPPPPPPSSEILSTDRSKAVLLSWFIFVKGRLWMCVSLTSVLFLTVIWPLCGKVTCRLAFFMRTKLTLALNKSRASKFHHLNKLRLTRVPNTTYKVSWQLAYWFGRRFLKLFFTLYGMAAILVTWQNKYLFILIFFFLKIFLWNLVTNGLVVSEKNKFYFSYLNDLDLKYSCSFIYWFSSLHLPILRPHAAIVSEKFKVLIFFHTKVYANNFDLGLK